MTRVYRLTSELPDETADALKGTFIDDDSYDLLIAGEDADVLKPDGEPLLMLRRGVLDPDLCRDAYGALKRAARPSRNRGAAAGGRRRRGNTLESKPVLSGIAGFYDRSAREPFCRTTEFTRDNLPGWRRVLPLVRSADRVFRENCPDRYAAQMRAVRRTPPEWVIPGTSFSTITVNKNYATAVHKDAGDYRPGFGVLTVVRYGAFTGGLLVFPKFRVAVDIQTADVLLADVHQWHGNTPLRRGRGFFSRLSVVMYFREKMTDCLPPAAELEWAKDRRDGEPLDSNRRPIGRNLPGETLAEFLRRELGNRPI